MTCSSEWQNFLYWWKFQNSLQPTWKLLSLSKCLLGETRANLEGHMVLWCNGLAFKDHFYLISRSNERPEQCFAAIISKMLLFIRDLFLPKCFYWMSSCVAKMVLKSSRQLIWKWKKIVNTSRTLRNVHDKDLIFVISTL